MFVGGVTFGITYMFWKIANTRVMIYIYIYIHTISCWSQPLPCLTRRPVTQTQEKSMLPYKACHFPCPHQSRASRPGYAWILDVPGRGEMFLILLLLYDGSFHLKSFDSSLSLWPNRLQGWHSHFPVVKLPRFNELTKLGQLGLFIDSSIVCCPHLLCCRGQEAQGIAFIRFDSIALEEHPAMRKSVVSSEMEMCWLCIIC